MLNNDRVSYAMEAGETKKFLADSSTVQNTNRWWNLEAIINTQRDNLIELKNLENYDGHTIRRRKIDGRGNSVPKARWSPAPTAADSEVVLSTKGKRRNVQRKGKEALTGQEIRLKMDYMKFNFYAGKGS